MYCIFLMAMCDRLHFMRAFINSHEHKLTSENQSQTSLWPAPGLKYYIH